MARGGRRQGAGRKPTGKVAMLVRVKPEVRARLERDAKRARRSLSAEVETQLADSLKSAPRADVATRALCYLISRMSDFARKGLPTDQFDWRTDRFDFEVFKSAVMQLLDRFAPDGTAESSRCTWGDTPDTPEDIAHVLVVMAVVGLTWDDAVSERYGESERGSDFNLMPQARRHLGLTPDEAKKVLRVLAGRKRQR